MGAQATAGATRADAAHWLPAPTVPSLAGPVVVEADAVADRAATKAHAAHRNSNNPQLLSKVPVAEAALRCLLMAEAAHQDIPLDRVGIAVPKVEALVSRDAAEDHNRFAVALPTSAVHQDPVVLPAMSAVAQLGLNNILDVDAKATAAVAQTNNVSRVDANVTKGFAQTVYLASSLPRIWLLTTLDQAATPVGSEGIRM